MAGEAAPRVLFDRLTHFFKQNEYNFEPLPDKGLLRAGFKGQNGNFRCFAHADEERRTIAFYARLESNVPEPKRQAVSEFITRVNYSLLFGNFEMDFSDGEVRFKTVLVLRDAQPTMDMLECLVLTNLRTFDRYYPGLMAILWSDVAPDEAVRRVESQK